MIAASLVAISTAQAQGVSAPASSAKSMTLPIEMRLPADVRSMAPIAMKIVDTGKDAAGNETHNLAVSAKLVRPDGTRETCDLVGPLKARSNGKAGLVFDVQFEGHCSS